MAKNLFSVPIFFIVFRETLESAIIVSVLLGLVEQIVHEDSEGRLTSTLPNENDPNKTIEGEDHLVQKRRLIRKLRIQVRLFLQPTTFTTNISCSALDIPRCRYRSLDCSRHRCRFHRSLVHQSVQSLV